MAISLSSSIIKGNKKRALKDLQKKAGQAAKGESKRKGMSNLFGTVGGMGLGALAAGLTGVTGGLALPLIMGLSSSAAKGLADAGSKGKFGKWLKTPGQTGKIASSSEYGYGAEEAGDIQEALQESRDATSWTPQSMLEDVALSYLSAGVGGKLKGVGKDVMGGNFSKAITGVDNYSLADAPINNFSPNLDFNLDFMKSPNFSFSDFMSTKDFKNGGMIPKYENGGIIDQLLEKGYNKKEGKHNYSMGEGMLKGMDSSNGLNLMRVISKFETPEGDRYYPGEASSRSSSIAQRKAMMDAASRAYHSPADSITTDQLEELKKLGLFMGGGKVDMNNSNTLYDYFAAQGKTMGGSDTMSIAQKLGRR